MIVLALALPVLGGCGGAEALDPGAAQSLQQQVRELAVVTQEGNLELAVDRAEALKAAVQQAEDSGAVTPGRAERIQQNIEAFINSVQPAEVPAPTAPAVPSTEPAPADTVPPTTPNRRRGIEDSGTPADRQREASEEAAEEAEKFAEKQEKERQKQEEENSGED